MEMQEIIERVRSLAENDQSIPQEDIYAWTDQAMQRINVALSAKFPLVKDQPTSYEPEIDNRWHEAFVVFCVAKYRESDSAYNESGYFMEQFNDMIMTMQRDMNIPPSFRADHNVQQIEVTDDTVISYDLEIPSGSYIDYIDVYHNNKKLKSTSFRVSSITETITLVGLTLTIGDKITVVFENNSDLNNPPYSWWGQTGW